jgi:hypothetical protein
LDVIENQLKDDAKKTPGERLRPFTVIRKKIYMMILISAITSFDARWISAGYPIEQKAWEAG